MPGTEFKNQVDNLMNMLFGAGVASHATIIEQINYLVFLRSLSKKDDSAMILDSSAEKIFSGELAKYHWDNLLVLNSEVLFTTLEEIFRKLPELAMDQTIRLLFRDAHVKIFDKPTLRRLIHEIEKMMSELEKVASSGHTDIFGDMYEYLLSKQAQAGTLGQFRTPRHIIKFIVDVIDPKKGETILDPACGTAGFLVSALEHLKEKYTSDELKKEGRLVMDKLKKGERDFVYQHTFTGFDSDFDMFKFGLMNLYLHKLEHPNIKRQNTLVDTAGDRTKWDIILANPPFAGALDQDSVSEDLRMNTRATEVLFLKYIVDHLSNNGRAGVIVPEGVVFSSTTAHKKIRQILVEDAGLWCVVSLPSGVFNPYAGVKTSILFFDKSKKDKNSEILFVKVENDGFDLGAQRRPIDENDLPKTINVINQFRNGHKTEDNSVTIVAKTEIVHSESYLLSSEKYKITEDDTNAKFPIVEIGNYISTITPPVKIKKSDFLKNGDFPVIDQSQNYISGYTNNISATINPRKQLVLFGDHTCSVKIMGSRFAQGADGLKIIETNAELDPKYLYYYLQVTPVVSDGYKRHFGKLKNTKIPLPPLEIQKQIVEELDGYQKIIDGAKQVAESWKPRINTDPTWKAEKLESLINIRTGKLNANKAVDNGEYPFFTCSKEEYKINSYSFDCEALLLAGNNATADYDVKHYKGKFDAYQRTYVINIKDTSIISYQFLKSELEQKLPELKQKSIGNLTKYLTLGVIQDLTIPVPSLEIQKQLVEKIEAERKLVGGNKKLIEIYQQKIKEKLESLWKTEK